VSLERQTDRQYVYSVAKVTFFLCLELTLTPPLPGFKYSHIYMKSEPN